MENKINIENYEAFLLDLAEGRLSFADEQALIHFLAKHPELEADLDELPILGKEQISLEENFKSNLLRNQSSGLSEKDHLMIAAIEGELSAEEQLDLDQLLHSDEEAQKDFAYYQKTRIKAEKVSFPLKDQLVKRESRVIPLWASISSIAAAILFLIYFGLPQAPTYTPNTFSYHEQKVEETPGSFAFVIADEQKSFDKQKQPTGGIETKVKIESHVAQKSLAPEKNPGKVDERNKLISVDPIDRKEMADLENDKLNAVPLTKEEIDPPGELAIATQEQKPTETATENTVLSPLEYARAMIKKDVLKNRSLAESVKDEVANLTKEKVNFEQSEDESKAQFALNIGKLKIRKK